MQKPNVWYRWFLVSIFILILIFTALTPLCADDFSYSFSWYDNSRITSVAQIIPSMVVHRQLTNGRVFSHGLVQFFLMLPKPVFDVFNAVNAVLLCILAGRLLSPSEKEKNTTVLLVFFLILWIFLPAFGENFLWLDGSINYSWGLTILFLFLWPFLADTLGLSRRKDLWITLLTFPLSFVAGAYSESGSLCTIFLAVCCIILLWRDKKRFPLLHAIWVLTACAGFLFLMSAPATAGRSGGGGLSAIANNCKVILTSAEGNLFLPYILFAILLGMCLSVKADKRRILLAVLFFTANLASLISYVFALYFANRHFCFPGFFTALSCALLLSALPTKSSAMFKKALIGALLVFFVLRFATGMLDVAVSYHKGQERNVIIASALQSGESSVTLEAYLPSTSFGTIYQLSYDDPQTWPNTSIADYYGLETVYGILPSS